MTAWLILSQAGNKYTAAEDKTFTGLFRQRLFLRLLPAYIFIDPFCYAKRSFSTEILFCFSCEFEDSVFTFVTHAQKYTDYIQLFNRVEWTELLDLTGFQIMHSSVYSCF